MTATVNRNHISIILIHTQIPENIGSVARAMSNMGLHRLVLVRPKNCDLSRVLKTATGRSIDIVEQMAYHENLRDALKSYGYVVGTTARIGTQRPAMAYPHSLSKELIPISQKNQVAILFGPEDRGLSNAQLRYCDTVATIPTAGFSSINLAQAVMIFSYEIFISSRHESLDPIPRLADKYELEGMYDHLKDVLMKIGFVNPQNPEHWMLNIRRFLSRITLRAREVRIIRGVCRQIDWYTEQLEKMRRREKNAGIDQGANISMNHPNDG